MENELEVEEKADADEASSTSPSLHRDPPRFCRELQDPKAEEDLEAL